MQQSSHVAKILTDCKQDQNQPVQTTPRVQPIWPQGQNERSVGVGEKIKW